jgi:hypothetical protein
MATSRAVRSSARSASLDGSPPGLGTNSCLAWMAPDRVPKSQYSAMMQVRTCEEGSKNHEHIMNTSDTRCCHKSHKLVPTSHNLSCWVNML